MDNGFRKFKRKIRTGVIIRALLTGLSVGILAVAVQWLLAKLTAGQPDFVFYGLVGGGLALLTVAVMLLLTLPTDKRLAKKLDNRLQMHEKVQTMVAFRQDTDSEMVALQRENTQQLLMQTPGKKARGKLAWMSVILPVVAVACLVVTILIPVQAQKPEPQPVDTWQLNNYDEGKLLTLIEYVRTSNMQTEPKNGVVAELEDLLVRLRTVKKQSSMQELVIESIKRIHSICEVCDTYSVVIDPLRKTSSQYVTEFADYVGTLKDTNVAAYMTNLLDDTLAENRGERAGLIASNIQKALEGSGLTDDNAIYAAVSDFAEEMAKVTDDTTDDALRATLKNMENLICNAVEQPGIDLSVEKYTINRLMTIFGIEPTQIPPEIMADFNNSLTGNVSSPDKEEDEENGTQGGLGPGELLLGSDDQIYDPDIGTYVPLADVMEKYIELYTQYVSDGVLTPEMEEIISDYLAILARVPKAE